VIGYNLDKKVYNGEQADQTKKISYLLSTQVEPTIVHVNLTLFRTYISIS
jgi:hypothetical protein